MRKLIEKRDFDGTGLCTGAVSGPGTRIIYSKRCQQGTWRYKVKRGALVFGVDAELGVSCFGFQGLSRVRCTPVFLPYLQHARAECQHPVLLLCG